MSEAGRIRLDLAEIGGVRRNDGLASCLEVPAGVAMAAMYNLKRGFGAMGVGQGE
jgi:hypothetical protein